MTGMYQSRDIVSQGKNNLGTRGPRIFVQGHIVLGRPITPPQMVCSPAKKVHIKTNVWFNGKKKTGFQENINVNLYFLGPISAYESKFPKANMFYVKI